MWSQEWVYRVYDAEDDDSMDIAGEDFKELKEHVIYIYKKRGFSDPNELQALRKAKTLADLDEYTPFIGLRIDEYKPDEGEDEE